MKRAVILHAMEQNSQGHWYPWLKLQLETRGYQVWTPNLPNPDFPNTQQTTEFLLANKDWDFSDNIIIGHSSGAVEVLYLLQSLPKNIKVKEAVIISSFDRPVPGMEGQHKDVFTEPLDFEEIKASANRFTFIHGADDPWCPVEGARNLVEATGGELILVENGGHFSTSLDSKYTEFPELINILEERNIL